MEVKREIIKIIKTVLPTGSDAIEIATHLMSDAVGVTCIQDLKDVPSDLLLPAGIKVAPLKRIQLTNAFAKLRDLDSNTDEMPTPGNAEPVQRTEPVAGPSNDENFFTFIVPWNKVSADVQVRLSEAKENRKRGAETDLHEMKRDIGTALVKEYKKFKKEHPGANKHPGRRIYSSVSEQVSRKFKEAVWDTYKGKKHLDGMSSFQRMLEIYVDNQLRKQDPHEPSTVSKAKATVGVLVEEYLPAISAEEEEHQKVLKEDLKMTAGTDPDMWDKENILKQMRESYELQRVEILKAKESITEPEQEEDEFLDPPNALLKLKEEWPYLFDLDGLKQHHGRLTKRNLEAPLSKFMQEHVDPLLIFLVTSTKTNWENMVIRLKAEESNKFDEIRLLLALEMISNHFHENMDQFIITVERTSDPLLFRWNQLAEIKHPCIIFMDNDKYKANTYWVCADKVPLFSVKTVNEALLGLINMCFIFDLEYPPSLPLTFEFFERYVLDMTVSDSKLRKKGKQVTVISENIRKFIKLYEEFKSYLQEKLQ